MERRRLYVKLFFIKAVVKIKDLNPVFKELNSFLDFLG